MLRKSLFAQPPPPPPSFAVGSQCLFLARLPERPGDLSASLSLALLFFCCNPYPYMGSFLAMVDDQQKKRITCMNDNLTQCHLRQDGKFTGQYH